MIFLNEYEIETAARRFAQPSSPDHDKVLAAAVTTLSNLVEWTNSHSDGWPYWTKPLRASQKLQELVYYRQDTEEAYRAALRPLKAFRTRQHADFEIVEV